MARVLTFSQLIDRSYRITTQLFKTYFIGAVILFIGLVVVQGLESGFYALAAEPSVKENTAVVIPLFLIGIVFTVLGIVVQVFQNAFGLVLAVDRKKKVRPTLKKAAWMLKRIILGGIWVMLRSFIWIIFFSIPFFVLGDQNPGMTMLGVLIALTGLGCGIFFLPRLGFVNVIQLKDGTGPIKSTAASFKRTQGYWGKIVGNNILMMLCMMLTTIAIIAVYALVFFVLYSTRYSLGNLTVLIVGVPLGLVAVVSGVIYIAGLSLFAYIFIVELYDTIKAHPKHKS